MSQSDPVTMLVIYKAKQGAEDALYALVEKHWPTLNELGLVTQQPPKIWRATGKDGRVSWVEIFQWKDGSSSGIAHQSPEVMSIWEPMGAVLDDLQLLQIDPVTTDFEGR
jgi:hypothetical protein